MNTLSEDKQLSIDIAKRIKEEGGIAYYVGGCVRDELLGIPASDFDVEIHGIDGDTLLNILNEFGKAQMYGKSYGIFSLAHSNLDFALPRTERKTGQKHTDFTVNVDPMMSLVEATKRRDFTVNSLMKEVLTGKIEDPQNGLTDLKNKVLRAVDPFHFIEDPLRVLRAARFAAQLGFTIDEKTIQLCSSIDISFLSKERVMEETRKALLSKKPSVYFDYLRKMNQLSVFYPELADLDGIAQNPKYHKEDCFIHTMMVIDEAAKVKERSSNPVYFMFACLCHDLGKKPTTKETDGVIHSIGHEVEGVPLVENMLSRLTNEKKLIDYAKELCLFHMKPVMMFYSHSKKAKCLQLMDECKYSDDLLLLSRCDGLGKIGDTSFDAEGFDNWCRKITADYTEFLALPHVTGDDLKSIGNIPRNSYSTILKRARKLEYSHSKESVLKILCADYIK